MKTPSNYHKIRREMGQISKHLNRDDLPENARRELIASNQALAWLSEDNIMSPSKAATLGCPAKTK